MAIDRRHKNAEWIIADNTGVVRTWDEVQIALLMDIRDQLQKLNGLLSCPNFIAIPATLRSIRRNTVKPREKK